MIGGVRGGAAQQVGGTARFMGPAQYEKTVATLKKKESQLKAAKKALTEHKRMMTVAFFSPEGYKAAVAKQQSLEKKVATLTKDVADLKRLLTVA